MPIQLQSNDIACAALSIDGLPPSHARYLYACVSGYRQGRETISFNVLTEDIHQATFIERHLQHKIRLELISCGLISVRRRMVSSDSSVVEIEIDPVDIDCCVKKEYMFRSLPSVSQAASLPIRDHNAWYLLVMMHSMSPDGISLNVPKRTLRSVSRMSGKTFNSALEFLTDAECVVPADDGGYLLVHSPATAVSADVRKRSLARLPDLAPRSRNKTSMTAKFINDANRLRVTPLSRDNHYETCCQLIRKWYEKQGFNLSKIRKMADDKGIPRLYLYLYGVDDSLSEMPDQDTMNWVKRIGSERAGKLWQMYADSCINPVSVAEEKVMA
jgi:hypothetical protein